MIKIDKKSYTDVGNYQIGYITIKKFDDYENISSAIPLYPIFNKGDGYAEEINRNKCLIFNSSDKNKELHKNLG